MMKIVPDEIFPFRILHVYSFFLSPKTTLIFSCFPYNSREDKSCTNRLLFHFYSIIWRSDSCHRLHTIIFDVWTSVGHTEPFIE